MAFLPINGEKPITKDSTWVVDSCYHTIMKEYVDTVWISSDSVLVRCPDGKFSALPYIEE